jgi:hypothetical protein
VAAYRRRAGAPHQHRPDFGDVLATAGRVEGIAGGKTWRGPTDRLRNNLVSRGLGYFVDSTLAVAGCLQLDSHGCESRLYYHPVAIERRFAEL